MCGNGIRNKKCSLVFASVVLFPKHGESDFRWYGNIPRSSVSYIFLEKQKSIQFPKLKTWEKWISIVREKHGKTQTFKIYGFLKYFGWSRDPCNYRNVGKVDFHSTRKVWENTNIPKLWVFQIFWVIQKSIQFPKHGKSGFP